MKPFLVIKRKENGFSKRVNNVSKGIHLSKKRKRKSSEEEMKGGF